MPMPMIILDSPSLDLCDGCGLASTLGEEDENKDEDAGAELDEVKVSTLTL